MRVMGVGQEVEYFFRMGDWGLGKRWNTSFMCVMRDWARGEILLLREV